MEEILQQLQALRNEVAEVNKKIDEIEVSKHFENWIPRKNLMQFLDYGDTQMAVLFKSGELKVAQIGNRKFIHKHSVMRYFEKNIKKQKV